MRSGRKSFTYEELIKRFKINLDRKNPRAKADIAHLPPEQLVESILKKERRLADVVGNIKRLLLQSK